MRAHTACVSNLRFPLYHSDYVAPDGLSHVDKHQSNRATTNYCDGVADLNFGFMQPTQHAGERLNHRCFFKTDVWRNNDCIQINDPPRNADVFGIGTIVEQ